MATVIVTGVTGDGGTNYMSIMCRINPTGSDTFSEYTNNYYYGFNPGATPEQLRQGMVSRIILGVSNDSDSNNAVIVPSDIIIPKFGLGNLSLNVASDSVGTATLSNGTITVNSPVVTSGSIIFMSLNTPSGTLGLSYSAPAASIIGGTSFVIKSVDSVGALVATDNSTVNWVIVN